MSTIATVGSASSAWSDFSASRASAIKEKMFARVDSDGSGSVDGSELQAMLDKMSERSGRSLGSAEELLAKMDSNADGSLDADELDSGMKSLLPPPSSTVEFANQRMGGMGGPQAGGHGGPPPGPPPDQASGDDSGSGSASESSSAAADPLDLNGDGTVSAQERATAALKQLVQLLSDAYSQTADTGQSASGTQRGLSLAA